MSSSAEKKQHMLIQDGEFPPFFLNKRKMWCNFRIFFLLGIFLVQSETCVSWNQVYVSSIKDSNLFKHSNFLWEWVKNVIITSVLRIYPFVVFSQRFRDLNNAWSAERHRIAKSLILDMGVNFKLNDLNTLETLWPWEMTSV